MESDVYQTRRRLQSIFATKNRLGTGCCRPPARAPGYPLPTTRVPRTPQVSLNVILTGESPTDNDRSAI